MGESKVPNYNFSDGPGVRAYRPDLPPLPPRDCHGYGQHTPDPKWPNGAKIAINFVLNYEEGGENTPANGDPTSEAHLSEVQGKVPVKYRDLNMESQFEYGSRAGVWRVMRIFAKYGYNFTTYAVAKAMENNPAVLEALDAAGHEIACHGYRWTKYMPIPEAEEREHIKTALKILKTKSGKEVGGWYLGRPSLNTRRLISEVYEELGLDLVYQSDWYNDDLPYWVPSPSGSKKGLVVVPYTLCENDFKFATASMATGEQFFEHLRDTFDMLYEEGRDGSPKMFSVGLHARLVGRPGRAQALNRFLEYISKKEGVWVARRDEIALHWRKTFPDPFAQNQNTEAKAKL